MSWIHSQLVALGLVPPPVSGDAPITYTRRKISNHLNFFFFFSVWVLLLFNVYSECVWTFEIPRCASRLTQSCEPGLTSIHPPAVRASALPWSHPLYDISDVYFFLKLLLQPSVLRLCYLCCNCMFSVLVFMITDVYRVVKFCCIPAFSLKRNIVKTWTWWFMFCHMRSQ